VEPPVEKQNDQEFLKTWTRSVKTPIQLRVLNVLRSWVEKHFRDFYQDPELLTKLRNFLKNEVTSETMQRIASQILRQTEAVPTTTTTTTTTTLLLSTIGLVLFI
jgi:Ras-specific guanine nucleotide-releasing factor 1/Ras-specific guanine nucleotide-releasing factor 2